MNKRNNMNSTSNAGQAPVTGISNRPSHPVMGGCSALVSAQGDRISNNTGPSNYNNNNNLLHQYYVQTEPNDEILTDNMIENEDFERSAGNGSSARKLSNRKTEHRLKNYKRKGATGGGYSPTHSKSNGGRSPLSSNSPNSYSRQHSNDVNQKPRGSGPRGINSGVMGQYYPQGRANENQNSAKHSQHGRRNNQMIDTIDQQNYEDQLSQNDIPQMPKQMNMPKQSRMTALKSQNYGGSGETNSRFQKNISQRNKASAVEGVDGMSQNINQFDQIIQNSGEKHLHERITKKNQLFKSKIQDFYSKKQIQSAMSQKSPNPIFDQTNNQDEYDCEKNDLDNDDRGDYDAYQRIRDGGSKTQQDVSNMQKAQTHRLKRNEYRQIQEQSRNTNHHYLQSSSSNQQITKKRSTVASRTGGRVTEAVSRRNLGQPLDDPDERPIHPSPTRQFFVPPPDAPPHIHEGSKTQRFEKQKNIYGNQPHLKNKMAGDEQINVSADNENYSSSQNLSPRKTDKKNQRITKVPQATDQAGTSTYLRVLQNRSAIMSSKQQSSKQISQTPASKLSKQKADQFSSSRKKSYTALKPSKVNKGNERSKQKFENLEIRTTKLNLTSNKYQLNSEKNQPLSGRVKPNNYTQKQAINLVQDGDEIKVTPANRSKNINSIKRGSIDASSSITASDINMKLSQSSARRTRNKNIMAQASVQLSQRKSSNYRIQTLQSIDQEDSDMDDDRSRIVNKIKNTGQHQTDKNKFMKKAIGVKQAAPIDLLGGRSSRKAVQTSLQVNQKKQSTTMFGGIQTQQSQKTARGGQTNTAGHSLNKAQKPTNGIKTNSNNIGILHHSKSNSLSINQISSMKTINNQVDSQVPADLIKSEQIAKLSKVTRQKFNNVHTPKDPKNKIFQISNGTDTIIDRMKSSGVYSNMYPVDVKQTNQTNKSNKTSGPNKKSQQQAPVVLGGKNSTGFITETAEEKESANNTGRDSNIDSQGLNSFKNAKMYNTLKNKSNVRVSAREHQALQKLAEVGTVNNPRKNVATIGQNSNVKAQKNEKPQNQQNVRTGMTKRKNSNSNSGLSQAQRDNYSYGIALTAKSGNNQDPNPAQVQTTKISNRTSKLYQQDYVSRNLKSGGFSISRGTGGGGAMTIGNSDSIPFEHMIQQKQTSRLSQYSSESQSNTRQRNLNNIINKQLQQNQMAERQTMLPPKITLDDNNTNAQAMAQRNSMPLAQRKVVNTFDKVTTNNNMVRNVTQTMEEGQMQGLSRIQQQITLQQQNLTVTRVGDQGSASNACNKRRDRSHTHHLPVSTQSDFRRDMVGDNLKTHRLDKGNTSNSRGARVRFQERHGAGPHKESFSVTSAGDNPRHGHTQGVHDSSLSLIGYDRPGMGGPPTISGYGAATSGMGMNKQLSNLRDMREQKKISKSIQKMQAFNSCHSERSHRDGDVNLQKLLMDDRQVNIGNKIQELQSQLNKMNELSQSLERRTIRVRSGSFYRQSLQNANNQSGVAGAHNNTISMQNMAKVESMHSTSQKQLQTMDINIQNQNMFALQDGQLNTSGGGYNNNSNMMYQNRMRMNQMQVYTVDIPQKHGSSGSHGGSRHSRKITRQNSSNQIKNNENQTMQMQKEQQQIFQQMQIDNQKINYQMLQTSNNFNSTTKKVMIDLSFNPHQDDSRGGYLNSSQSSQGQPVNADGMRKFSVNLQSFEPLEGVIRGDSINGYAGQFNNVEQYSNASIDFQPMGYGALQGQANNGAAVTMNCSGGLESPRVSHGLSNAMMQMAGQSQQNNNVLSVPHRLSNVGDQVSSQKRLGRQMSRDSQRKQIPQHESITEKLSREILQQNLSPRIDIADTATIQQNNQPLFGGSGTRLHEQPRISTGSVQMQNIFHNYKQNHYQNPRDSMISNSTNSPTHTKRIRNKNQTQYQNKTYQVKGFVQTSQDDPPIWTMSGTGEEGNKLLANRVNSERQFQQTNQQPRDSMGQVQGTNVNLAINTSNSSTSRLSRKGNLMFQPNRKGSSNAAGVGININSQGATPGQILPGGGMSINMAMAAALSPNGGGMNFNMLNQNYD